MDFGARLVGYQVAIGGSGVGCQYHVRAFRWNVDDAPSNGGACLFAIGLQI
jgi:hypothetical protein